MMRILLRVTKGKEGLCTVVVLVLEAVNVKIPYLVVNSCEWAE